MKKLGTIAAIAGALMLTGCSADAGSQYVDAVVDRAPGILDYGDAEKLKSLGSSICDALDNGASPHDLAGTYETELGWSLREAGAVIVEAATILCPEHVDKVAD